MSEFEIPFKLAESHYNEVLLLEKYGDNYGIVLSQESKQGGTNYKRWVYPQRRVDNKNEPADKAIPHRIPLGSKTQALTILQGMIASLRQEVAKGQGLPKTKDREDIPF